MLQPTPHGMSFQAHQEMTMGGPADPDDVCEEEPGMRTVIRRRGDGAAISIPAAVMKAARLEVGQEVELRVEGGRILIVPVSPPRYNLDELIAGITDENRHELIDFGEAVGKEVW